jgi:hypothetical protein
VRGIAMKTWERIVISKNLLLIDKDTDFAIK